MTLIRFVLRTEVGNLTNHARKKRAKNKLDQKPITTAPDWPQICPNYLKHASNFANTSRTIEDNELGLSLLFHLCCFKLSIL